MEFGTCITYMIGISRDFGSRQRRNPHRGLFPIYITDSINESDPDTTMCSGEGQEYNQSAKLSEPLIELYIYGESFDTLLIILLPVLLIPS